MKPWTRLIVAASLPLAALSMLPNAARADIPALSRPFDAEAYEDPTYATILRSRRILVIEAVAGLISRNTELGTASPALRDGNLLGRSAAALEIGAARIGAEATWDGMSNADAREYPLRVHAGMVWPRLFVAGRLSAGFDHDGYRGSDLTLESRPWLWDPHLKNVDLKVRVWTWVRGRTLQGQGKPVLNPALGLAIQHVPIFASRLNVEASTQSDLVDGGRPATFGMLQVGWESVEHSMSGGSDLELLPGGGSEGSSQNTFVGFAHIGWAVPFDDRSAGRLAAAAGLRLFVPFLSTP